MTQVNLLPPQILERKKTRRVTMAVASAAGAVVVLLALVYTLQVSRLSKVDDQLAAQASVNAGLQSEIAELQRFDQLQALLSQRQAVVDGVSAGEVLWSGVLHDLSLVTPGRMYLSTMTGSLAGAVPGDGGAAPPVEGGTSLGGTMAGNMQFTGVTFAHPTVSQWMERLEEVDGWVNAWVTSSSLTTIGDVEVVTFTGSVDLSPEATSDGRVR